MELTVLDPFGDYQTEGYLRNLFKEKDLEIVGHLETAAFEAQVLQAIRFLRRQPTVNYEHITETHRQLFDSLYPWAGQDRSQNAPYIAIAKAGYKTLFAHPADIRKAAEYALDRAKDTKVFARPSRRSFWLFSSRTSFPGRQRANDSNRLCRALSQRRISH
jgi:cell filamentation protein